MLVQWLALLGVFTLAFAGCSEDDATQPPAPDTEADVLTEGSEDVDDPGEVSDEPEEQPDPLPEPAALPPYSGEACPAMEPGTVEIVSAGLQRAIHLTLPAQPADAPVLFIYHGNGSNAAQFVQFFQAERIAREFGVIVVTPSSTGQYQIEWPIIRGERKGPDETLFLDVLACLDEAFGIDRRRVYTTGFSAGALWSTHLVMQRGEYLAGAAIFSGGVSTFTTAYTTPAWPMPVLATHGGPTDEVVIRFDQTTDEMVRKLVADGHLTVLCTHSRGHTIPWNIPDLMMPFLLAHAYGEVDTDAYADGLPGVWPEGCVLQRAD